MRNLNEILEAFSDLAGKLAQANGAMITAYGLLRQAVEEAEGVDEDVLERLRRRMESGDLGMN